MMIVKKEELIPEYISQGSFNRRAWVEYDDQGNIYLISYETTVAVIKDGLISESSRQEAHIFDWYSATTAKHINEFLQQHGFEKLSKEQMKGGVKICKLI